MEYLVAALILLFAVGYGVLIAVNVEKGKRWALEIAQAISMLDPHTMSFELRARTLESEPVVPKPVAKPVAEVPDRLAA